MSLTSVLAALALILTVMLPGRLSASDPWTAVTSSGETVADIVADGAGWLPFEGEAPQGWTANETFVDLPLLPPALPPGARLGSVIGDDGRTQVTATGDYPFRAIAYLSVAFPGAGGFMCTGWFIGPRTLATAGHCVHNGITWASRITVYPGRNGRSLPYGSHAAVKWATVKGWTEYRKPEFDYGAIQLDTDVGTTVGWFGFRAATAGDKGRRVWVTGYPADKPWGTMWQMGGRLKAMTRRKLYYPIDTYGGQSGSPVRFRSGRAPGHWGFGVHAYAVGLKPHPRYNSGTKFSTAIFNRYSGWRSSW